jgi:hypothetical protein
VEERVDAFVAEAQGGGTLVADHARQLDGTTCWFEVPR